MLIKNKNDPHNALKKVVFSLHLSIARQEIIDDEGEKNSPSEEKTENGQVVKLFRSGSSLEVDQHSERKKENGQSDRSKSENLNVTWQRKVGYMIKMKRLSQQIIEKELNIHHGASSEIQ